MRAETNCAKNCCICPISLLVHDSVDLIRNVKNKHDHVISGNDKRCGGGGGGGDGGGTYVWPVWLTYR